MDGEKEIVLLILLVEIILNKMVRSKANLKDQTQSQQTTKHKNNKKIKPNKSPNKKQNKINLQVKINVMKSFYLFILKTENSSTLIRSNLDSKS